MADNQGIPFSSTDEKKGLDFIFEAQRLVREEIDRAYPQLNDDVTVYVVSFTYILGNWKALVSSSLADGRYYEVTYSATRSQTYVDTYIKTANTVIENV